MSDVDTHAPTAVLEGIQDALDTQNITKLSSLVNRLNDRQKVSMIERLAPKERAIVYRLLPKQEAFEVFETLDPSMQGELLDSLHAEEVAAIFAELEPDDRVWLLDELPAVVANRLMRGLSSAERSLTMDVLGYPKDSIGRRMSPELVITYPNLTVAQTFERVRDRLEDAETVYTLPVVDSGRRIVGVVTMRDLVGAQQDALISDLMVEADTVVATENAESAARHCADAGHLAVPVVDNESRLVGIFTIDDAVRILEREASEDVARQGGTEPLHRPYLSTPIVQIVRSRIVWLFVLAVGAVLTVQVLSVFEGTLAQVTALSLFVPLLIGTGGNTGNQAATTVTRALALDDVRPRDIVKVLFREMAVGALLGTLLGLLGFLITTIVFDWHIGLVIGCTLLAICTVAASIGGMMPMLARAIGVDPAVFSNPFISTLVDATGLIIYFLIAKSILGL